MARLNLTLDEVTFRALGRDAKRQKQRLATRAREILHDALLQREQAHREERWAEAYRADRADARRLLGSMEAAQLDVMGDEEA